MKNQLELKKGLKKKLKIVPIGLGFSFWTALGLVLRGPDLGLGLDNKSLPTAHDCLFENNFLPLSSPVLMRGYYRHRLRTFHPILFYHPRSTILPRISPSNLTLNQHNFRLYKTDHFCTTFSKCPLLIFVFELGRATCEPIVLENKIFYKRSLEFNSWFRNKHPTPPGVVETEIIEKHFEELSLLSNLSSNPSFAAEVTLNVTESNKLIILTKWAWKWSA